MIEQVDRLRALLLETEPNWNIERHGTAARVAAAKPG